MKATRNCELRDVVMFHRGVDEPPSVLKRCAESVSK